MAAAAGRAVKEDPSAVRTRAIIGECAVIDGRMQRIITGYEEQRAAVVRMVALEYRIVQHDEP